MERLLSMIYNWNVYKVFKNGKRAKMPFYVFEHGDTENVEEYFMTQIKEKFTEKIRASRVMILRSDLPQVREEEKNVLQEKTQHLKQAAVIHKYFNNSSSLEGTALTTGLILCAQSGWEWQWAILESGTLRFLAGVSRSFKSPAGAHAWMREEINKL